MSHRITCPHCAAPLRLPEGLTAGFAVCPRCQGNVPNPGAPEGGAAEDWNIRPVLAIDDELGEGTPKSNRRLWQLTLLLLVGVACGGGLTGLIADHQRSLGPLESGIQGMLLTLSVFALAILPAILLWLTRMQFVKRAAPSGGFGRVVLVVVLWMLFSALAMVAAFVLFFLACLGGMHTGDALR